jgi:hypothetical protein
MKKKVLTLALVLMSGIIFSLSAQADPLIHVTNPKGGSFSGGPFYIVEQSLYTFCIEMGEHFVPGQGYYYSVDPYAVGGGPDSNIPNDNKDYVDPKTAWLYLQFLNNSSFAPDLLHQEGLQLAIWKIEEEFGVPFPGYTGYSGTIVTYADEYILAANTASIDPNILTYVHALNLYADTAHTQWIQSQLTVPEPGILILLGIALSAVGLGARRYVF